MIATTLVNQYVRRSSPSEREACPSAVTTSPDSESEVSLGESMRATMSLDVFTGGGPGGSVAAPHPARGRTAREMAMTQAPRLRQARNGLNKLKLVP